jgi:hypothetical protein
MLHVLALGGMTMNSQQSESKQQDKRHQLLERSIECRKESCARCARWLTKRHTTDINGYRAGERWKLLANDRILLANDRILLANDRMLLATLAELLAIRFELLAIRFELLATRCEL